MNNHPDLVQFLKLQLETNLLNIQNKSDNNTITQTCDISNYKILIEWLYDLNITPFFIWQSRTQNTTFIGIGSSDIYDTLPDYVDNNSIKIWGGQGFLPTTNYYFRPILQIEIQESLNELASIQPCNKNNSITAEVSLNFSDIEKTKKFLSNLDFTNLDNNHKNNILDNKPIAIKSSFSYLPNKEGWQNQIDAILKHIEQNHFEKLVISRQAIFKTVNKKSAWNLFKQSIEHNGNCYHLFWKLDDNNFLVSATPERLILRDNDKLTTEALAGTAFLNENQHDNLTSENWLKNDDKNLRENFVVVTDIKKQLHSIAKDVKPDDSIEIIKQRKVQHLKLAIHAYLKENISTKKILKDLHPTAAILGFPRDKILKLIKEDSKLQEPFARNWYSGYFGYTEQRLGQQTAEYCVLLRCAHIQSNTQNNVNECTCYSGAGIVAGSVASSEWEELDQKLSTLTDLFLWQ